MAKAKRTQKIKFRLRKNSIFLGLIQKFRTYYFNKPVQEYVQHPHFLSFKCFTKYRLSLLTIFFIFDFIKAWTYLDIRKYKLSFNLFQYYTSTRLLFNTPQNVDRFQNTTMVVFSRPCKQIFLTLYDFKPVFIFTGGLMRKVMNEKRKSSKKLYKVAISLIKLATVLASKPGFFVNTVLKLLNVGSLRFKILTAFFRKKLQRKVVYVVIKFRIDFTSQKLETRRSIKKYVKKRFKIF